MQDYENVARVNGFVGLRSRSDDDGDNNESDSAIIIILKKNNIESMEADNAAFSPHANHVLVRRVVRTYVCLISLLSFSSEDKMGERFIQY